jgi:exodeoxyribonuclease VIII
LNDIMLDLETMGTGPSAAIIAIGAVAFDLEAGTLGERFYEVVDLASSVAQGGVMDAATVLWWLGQSEEARDALRAPGMPLPDALLQFSRWMGLNANLKEVRIWGNGAAFDNVVLASAYDRAGIVRPWAFWNDRCYRTVKALHPEVKMNRAGTHHHALDDAQDQARHLIQMLRAAEVASGS